MFTIDELSIPSTLADEGAADFIRFVEVGNVVDEFSYGTAELAYEPAEELPHYNDPFQPHRALVARVDGAVVGRAKFETQADDDADAVWLSVGVLPQYRGRGIGSALAQTLESLTIAAGKTKALAYVAVQDAPGERMLSPTGFGTIPADADDVRFSVARGYSFEQVERISRLPLPVSKLDSLLSAAVERSGPDYVIHTWENAAPGRWHADIALMATRMSTDAPSAGLEEPEDVWTVERVVAANARNAASPRTPFEAVVEHVPSGHLVGFTVLSVPAQQTRTVDQYATLVLREHRGHGLGMLLKVANLVHLQQLAPGHPSIITFNAEENRHMLSVNEALGFVAIGYESAWRKDL